MITLDELAQCLNQVETDKDTYNKVIKAAEELEQNKKAEKTATKTEKSKKQLVVVLKSPEPVNPDTVAHIFELGGEEDAGTIITKVKTAAVEHNLAQKRKKNIVTEFDDLVHIKRKFAKDAGYMLKSKTDWIRTIVLDEKVQFGGFEKTNKDSK